MAFLISTLVPSTWLVSRAQAASFEILALEEGTNGGWTLTFQGLSTNAADYSVEFTTMLDGAAWWCLSNCPILSVPGGQFAAYLPPSGDLTRFFRVLAGATAQMDSPKTLTLIIL
jgi:hypothetical protein